jgi:hypothetical protein
MSNEIHVPGSTGLTLYCLVRNAAGQVWRPASSAFEAYNASNYANYATTAALTEQGATGYYLGSFPAAPAGLYRVDVRRQTGGSPAVADPAYASGELRWSGTAEVDLPEAIFSEDLPGSYVAGDAGYILGHLQTVSFADPTADADECISTVQFDKGEKKRVFANIRATTGTLTISGTPTVQLLDRSGAQVYGITGIVVTGNDAGALAQVRAWYDLNTAAPPSAVAIAAGRYTLCFTIAITKSTGGTETRIVKVPIKVEALA